MNLKVNGKGTRNEVYVTLNNRILTHTRSHTLMTAPQYAFSSHLHVWIIVVSELMKKPLFIVSDIHLLEMNMKLEKNRTSNDQFE